MTGVQTCALPISLVRRAMPQLIAYDIAGVQPMTQPTGLIFAMKSRYATQNGTEALFNEADTDFAGTGTHAGSTWNPGSNTTGTAMTTAAAEALGTSGGGSFGEMAFSIEKTSVTAKTRTLLGEVKRLNEGVDYQLSESSSVDDVVSAVDGILTHISNKIGRAHV